MIQIGRDADPKLRLKARSKSPWDRVIPLHALSSAPVCK
jgi:hypothetical protein